jgi:hypothetical protein
MPLATLAQAAEYGYDPQKVAPMLQRAETRVRGYLKSRASACAVLAIGATVPPSLTELVLSVANRLAMTPDKVAMGAVSEQSGGEQVAFGAQAYAGTSDLTQPEKTALDRLYPNRMGSFDLLSGETT